MNYQETLNRLSVLRESLKTDAGPERLANTRELMRLKRNLCKFKEHKVKKENGDGEY